MDLHKQCMTNRTLVVIPARGGSVEVPRKNIRNLNGRPLISYAIKTCKSIERQVDVIVSTDDEEIAEVAINCGADVPFMRPSEISGSSATLLLVVKHAFEFFNNRGVIYDAVLSVQPTCPFLTTTSLEGAIDLYETGTCDSVVSLAEFTSGHPVIAKRLDTDGTVSSFFKLPNGAITHPRQKREAAFYPCGAFYLRSSELLNESHEDAWHLGERVKGLNLNQLESHDINSLIDFKLAEVFFEMGGLNA